MKTNLITLETQHSFQKRGIGVAWFMGVCGQDGHSQAPMDGLAASHEPGNPDRGTLVVQQGTQENQW